MGSPPLRIFCFGSVLKSINKVSWWLNIILVFSILVPWFISNLVSKQHYSGMMNSAIDTMSGASVPPLHHLLQVKLTSLTRSSLLRSSLLCVPYHSSSSKVHCEWQIRELLQNPVSNPEHINWWKKDQILSLDPIITHRGGYTTYDWTSLVNLNLEKPSAPHMEHLPRQGWSNCVCNFRTSTGTTSQ